MIGQELYSLQPQEAVSAPVLQRVIFTTGPIVLPQVEIARELFQVPGDKALVLTSVAINGIAGGGQITTLVRLRVQDDVFNVLWQTRESPNSLHGGSAGLEFGVHYLDMQLLLMPFERLEAVIDFNAAAAANTLQASFQGILIPKGTLQLR